MPGGRRAARDHDRRDSRDGATAEHAGLYAQRAWNLAHGLGDQTGADAVLQAAQRHPTTVTSPPRVARTSGSMPGRPEFALAQVELVLTDASAHRFSAIRAWFARAFARIVAGRLDLAIEAGEAGSAQDLDQLGDTWSLLEEKRSGGLAITRIFTGHLDDAETICRRRIVADHACRLAARHLGAVGDAGEGRAAPRRTSSWRPSDCVRSSPCAAATRTLRDALIFGPVRAWGPWCGRERALMGPYTALHCPPGPVLGPCGRFRAGWR